MYVCVNFRDEILLRERGGGGGGGEECKTQENSIFSEKWKNGNLPL